MRKHILKSIQDHAATEYPREACGLLVRVGRREQYTPCLNTAATPSEEFRISPEEFAEAEDAGKVVGIFHSHPDATSRPSDRDLAMCEASGLPWHILSWPEGDLRTITPKGDTPLMGRPFVHGAWDCFAVVRDFYIREAGIELPNYERADDWWEDQNAVSLYEHNWESAGFFRVTEPRRGDMIVMRVGKTKHPNHAGIYLGNDPSLPGEISQVVGPGPFLLHHIYGGISEPIVYGGSWLERTELVLRHKNYPDLV